MKGYVCFMKESGVGGRELELHILPDQAGTTGEVKVVRNRDRVGMIPWLSLM